MLPCLCASPQEIERQYEPGPSAIIPLVVAHGAAWTAPTSMIELFDLDEPTRRVLEPLLVNFRFVLDDLSAQSSEALHVRTAASPLARLTLFLLQRARPAEDLLGELSGWVDLLEQVRAAGGDDLAAIIM